MATQRDNTSHLYDVIVVGAGPAGCEAAYAASHLGASTLCLSINLDTTGFPAGSPVLIEEEDDKRSPLLEEMQILGLLLPILLRLVNVCPAGLQAPDAACRILVDRRELGLSYKDHLESTDGLQLRQALVTSIAASQDAWAVTTRLDEHFQAACVVIAAGTFLEGKVVDKGKVASGGRRGEIPSNALAASLKELGLKFQQASAASTARLDGRILSRISGAGASSVAASSGLYADGSQLNENCLDDSHEITNELLASTGHWVTRNPYAVNHLILQAGQVGQSLEAATNPGLFFAGRAAGCSSYIESAALGAVAGHNAACRAIGKEPNMQLDQTHAVARLCQLVASGESRPVSLAGYANDLAE